MKNNKYSHLDSVFVSVAVETRSSFGPQKKVGHYLRSMALDDNSHQYLLPKFSVAVQRGNAATVVGSLPWASKMDDVEI